MFGWIVKISSSFTSLNFLVTRVPVTPSGSDKGCASVTLRNAQTPVCTPYIHAINVWSSLCCCSRTAAAKENGQIGRISRTINRRLSLLPYVKGARQQTLAPQGRKAGTTYSEVLSISACPESKLEAALHASDGRGRCSASDDDASGLYHNRDFFPSFLFFSFFSRIGGERLLHVTVGPAQKGIQSRTGSCL